MLILHITYFKVTWEETENDRRETRERLTDTAGERRMIRG